MRQLKRFITIIFIMVFLLGITSAFTVSVKSDEFVETSTSIPEISVIEIDLGDYQTEMFVGDTQLLVITFFPETATEQVATFYSSNTSVATINMIGRIKALAVGTTEISVFAGGIVQKFTLQVIAKKDESHIAVVDIDLGDYQSEMYVGKTQLLMPTTLPTKATDQDFTFSSSQTNVATINMMGRIKALNVGQTTISVSVGGVTAAFALTVTKEPIIAVDDIDMGDYQTSMYLGKTQVLTPTLSPTNATEQKMMFESSNTSVATINFMGRITAVGLGTTDISVITGKVKRKFTMSVIEEPKIAITDIDLGDYQKEMYIGKTQLIMPTLLPTNATEQKIAFSSSHPDIAMINLMGRITALAVGETEINVSTGGITRTFTLSVIEEPPVVRVTDIEISNFKKEIKVDESVDIIATPIPKNAKEQDVSFSSSNPSVVTINSSGKIIGVSTGTATIEIKADGVTKSMGIAVKVPTKSIDVNEDYIILRQGETFKLSVNVQPPDADQHVTYQSYATEIMDVSSDGIITAKKSGSGSILISTWDTSTVVNVIINEADFNNAINQDSAGNINSSTSLEAQNNLIERLRLISDDGVITVNGSETQKIISSVLKALYGTNKSIVIQYQNYSISIIGNEIKNVDNELLTKIDFSKVKNGSEILVNEGKNLPGKIHIQLFGDITYKYLYLQNPNKGIYELISSMQDDNKFTVDYNGKYLLTTNKLSQDTTNWFLIAIVAGIIFLGIGVTYIVIKKKYWFW